MQQVPAGRNMSRQPRGENVFIAERAGVVPAVSAADMGAARRQAQLTRCTVDEIGAPANAAEAAVCAVELLPVHIVVEAADGAEVGRTKGQVAAPTGGADGLSVGAAGTLHTLYRVSVCQMPTQIRSSIKL